MKDLASRRLFSVKDGGLFVEKKLLCKFLLIFEIHMFGFHSKIKYLVHVNQKAIIETRMSSCVNVRWCE